MHTFLASLVHLRSFTTGITCVWTLLAMLIVVHTGQPPVRAAEPAATIITQDITTDTTWTEAASPYHVTQGIRVQQGATLRVEPGVEIRTDANIGITVNGSIVAVGTSNAPILFTASVKQPNGWNGLYISSQAASAATLEHVVMEYGGMPQMMFAMLHNFDGGMTIRDSVFRDAGHSGIATTMSDRVDIVDTRFVDNGGPALSVSGRPQSDGLLQNLQATGNGTDAIVLDDVRFEGTHTLERAGLPYVARGALVIDDNGQVTVAPGVQFHSDGIFLVNGRLLAEGTAAQPITFRGVATTPGSWEGISFDGVADTTGKLPASSLRHIVVEHGGTVEQNNPGSAYGASVTVRNAIVTLADSVIRDGGNYGIAGRGGVEGDGNQLTVADTTISGHPSYALMFEHKTANPVLRNLRASGNGIDAVGVRGALSGTHVWEHLAIPYVVDQGIDVEQGATLTIEPGTNVRMEKEQEMEVQGRLNAVGTAEAPITFTGTTESAGWWRHLYVTGEAVLQHCDIGYGGASSTTGMVITESGTTVIQRCRIHHSADAGIEVSGIIPPVIDHNRIESNAVGVRNMLFEQRDVDARNNWWGDPSGPHHPALNPQGKGNAVGDDVLFDPWLRSPSDGEQGALMVSVSGRGRFVPGSTQDYAIAYSNATANPVENAVLMVALPDNAEYIDNSGGGTFWPQRHQVFWKLGTLAPNTTGVVSVRVRYFWGLPEGLKDSTQAFLGGSNVTTTEFDVQPYLRYTPVTVTAERPLTPAQLAAEQQAHPDLRQLYAEAIDDGFVLGTADTVTLSTGAQMTEIVMLRFEPDFAMLTLWRQGTRVVARTVDRSSYEVRNPQGTVRFSVQTGAWETIGNARMVSTDTAHPTASFGECMKNCIIELVPAHVVKNVLKGASTVSKAANCIKAASGDELSVPKCAQIIKKIPGVSEGIDLGKCNSDCQQDEDSHVCTEDKRVCEGYPFTFFAATQSITVYECDTETGRYGAGRTEKVCAVCEKCIEGVNGATCVFNQGIQPFHALLDPAQSRSRTPEASVVTGPRIGAVAPTTQTPSFARSQLAVQPLASDGECEECRQAKDPNAKLGVEGDAVPGQLMTYTIEYENVGSGEAFDVFVVDMLSEHFDATTLQLDDDGEYSAATRMITWNIGELAPTGQPGSKGSVSFSVRLKRGLPSGTVIPNQAVVHFPSVPEETPTNTVVNVVQPLAAVPQRLEVEAGKTLALVLAGRDAANTPLRFTVVEEPLYGTLSGTAPNLVYTPQPNFSGMDHVRFVVSNGTSTSRSADIEIRVLPASNDAAAPEVLWTEPSAGQTIVADRTPRFSDATGTLYAPLIQIGFNEALRPSSISNTTVRLSDEGGRALPAQVSYDASADQVILLSREPLKPGTTYTVTLTRDVQDAKGNGLAKEYRWSFQTAGMHTTFLPMVRR
jgi:hypothetical protein